MMLVPGDPLAHRALESLLRAEASVRRRLSADLESEGLSASGFSVLIVLTTAGGTLELRALRRRLRTSKANATEVVGTLEARGLVARHRLEHDRRAAAVTLTPAGEEVAERIFPEHSPRVDDVRRDSGARLAAHAGALTADAVAAFVGTKTEPPTLPLLDALRIAGRRVLLPVLREDMDLEWAPFTGAAELRPARLGLLEPTGPSSGLDAVGEADLVLAPALAVDPAGRRLGQGGGSYDRALERAGAPVVAVVFDEEVLDGPIPVEAHDRPVAGVLTPDGGLRWFADAF